MIVFPILVLVIINLWTAFVTSVGYTAWSIRVRNEVWYFLLGKPENRYRADHSELIAEGVLRWFRPLMFAVMNVLGIAFVIYATTNRK